MELGNMLLGHSRGEFPIPDRTLYRELIQPLFDAMRDAYTSQEVTPEMFGSLIQTCIESLVIDTSPKPTPEQIAKHHDTIRRRLAVNGRFGAYGSSSKSS